MIAALKNSDGYDAGDDRRVLVGLQKRGLARCEVSFNFGPGGRKGKTVATYFLTDQGRSLAEKLKKES